MTRRRPSPKARTPQWFELYNPRGGVPRETLPGHRRAREDAAAVFDRALALLDEPARSTLASALAVLGIVETEGEYDRGGGPRPRGLRSPPTGRFAAARRGPPAERRSCSSLRR